MCLSHVTHTHLMLHMHSSFAVTSEDSKGDAIFSNTLFLRFARANAGFLRFLKVCICVFVCICVGLLCIKCGCMRESVYVCELTRRVVR